MREKVDLIDLRLAKLENQLLLPNAVSSPAREAAQPSNSIPTTSPTVTTNLVDIFGGEVPATSSSASAALLSSGLPADEAARRQHPLRECA